MTMRASTPEQVRTAVRTAYADIAVGATTGCCGGGAGCGPSAGSAAIGYSDDERASVPDGADLGLGCGNPQTIASLSPGERVLDLGSGAGFDALLAARQVGASGQVIGVDMTPEMIARARRNAGRAGVSHVEFRLGDIEHLPVADASVDVVMSNCVINLSPDKPAVFREAFRVLVPGGRLAIADVVAVTALPDALAADLAAYTGGVAGAAIVADIEAMLTDAGFTEVRVDLPERYRAPIDTWLPGQSAGDYVASALIQAVKPSR
jgi:SAM-dependent methyltransferase